MKDAKDALLPKSIPQGGPHNALASGTVSRPDRPASLSRHGRVTARSCPGWASLLSTSLQRHRVPNDAPLRPASDDRVSNGPRAVGARLFTPFVNVLRRRPSRPSLRSTTCFFSQGVPRPVPGACVRWPAPAQLRASANSGSTTAFPTPPRIDKCGVVPWPSLASLSHRLSLSSYSLSLLVVYFILYTGVSRLFSTGDVDADAIFLRRRRRRRRLR